MNRQVNLTKRVKTSRGPRFCPAVFSANGRVKPDWVIVNAREEKHPEGSYYIEWYRGSKRVRQSVGKDASAAGARRQRQEQMLASSAMGLKIEDPEKKKNGVLLAEAISDYLEEIRLGKKPKTYAAYSTTLEYFLQSCNKQHVTDVERQDLLRFSAVTNAPKIRFGQCSRDNG